MFKTDHVTRLRQKSDNVTDVFTKTINDLHVINGELLSHHAEKTDRKNMIEFELAELEGIHKDNLKTIEMLQGVFN